MPEHKLQHYVPKCHFKPFTLDQAGAAINLFNISRAIHVKTAAVKGQCARDYFYGEDLTLERWLQIHERKYAGALRKIQNRRAIDENDLDVLRTFAYLQYSRTDVALRRTKMAEDEMLIAAYEGAPGGPPPEFFEDERTIMLSSIKMYLETREYVDDLKAVIVDNRTAIDFITSDDPAVFVNKFYAQRFKHSNFGVSSSGVLLVMPLAPRFALMCYDGQVYTILTKRGGFVQTEEIGDVLAFNELQYLKAANNIYYSNWESRLKVEEEFNCFAVNRGQSWHEVIVWVADGETKDGTRYRRATDEEKRGGQHTLVNLASRHPVPSRWNSALRYRAPPRTYSNGSAAGHVRKAARLRPDESLA